MTRGEKIKTERKKQGLTQKELASKTGIEVASICRIENDMVKKPHDDTIVLIANALNVKLIDLEPDFGPSTDDILREILMYVKQIAEGE